jgi:hypothetical protein
MKEPEALALAKEAWAEMSDEKRQKMLEGVRYFMTEPTELGDGTLVPTSFHPDYSEEDVHKLRWARSFPFPFLPGPSGSQPPQWPKAPPEYPGSTGI